MPEEIADRSKIVLLSIDGHFDPRKMPSGRGFGKNMKIECHEKNADFVDLVESFPTSA